MEEAAVKVEDVSKVFRLPRDKQNSIKSRFTHPGRHSYDEQKALTGVSFEVKKGEFFGIVGRNGSGKSTLLKLIAGIYTPTRGNIKVNGKLTPFIELGVGFNPDLTGRENVFLNGALLGFNRKQMATMYKDIVEFAELERFMGQKLKNYSSGMQVRLAFAIAVKAHNDILIFDEVLAVGDEAFQRKCLDVFETYKANKQTVILVTHGMDTVRKYCNRAILIEGGDIIASGNPNKVADVYSKINQTSIDTSNTRKNEASQDASKIKISLGGERGEANSFAVDDWLRLEMEWDKKIRAEAVWVDLYKKSGEHVSNFISTRDGLKNIPGGNSASLRMNLNISPGSYYIDVGLWDYKLENKLLSLYPACSFTVIDNWAKAKHKFGGLTRLDSKWS